MSKPSHTASRRTFRLYLLALLFAVLAGCTTTPTREAPTLDPVHQQAQALIDSGQYQAAAELYLSEASSARGMDRVRYRFQAAHWFLEAGALEQAAEIVAGIAARDLPPADQLQAALVNARIALGQHRPDAALDILRQIPTPQADSPHVAAFHRLRADAYTVAGNRLESARERVWLDGLLTDPEQRRTNHIGIWNALSGLSNTALERLSGSQPRDTLSGWMDLVRVARELRRHSDTAATALADWRRHYPAHPGEEFLLPQWLGQTTASGEPITRIALLLPVTGSLAGPAAAVRDGVLAARLSTADTGIAPAIHIYDTGAGPHTVWAQYHQAVVDGAQLVIGPLRKESVQSLAQSGMLDIPVLALNQTDADGHPNLYQFALAPEDEARQVAERARWEGLSGAVALIPEGPWGERVYSAFAERWAELGGEVLEIQRYGQNQADFGAAIQAMLNLDDSYARKRALVNLLGRKLEFEPRRRQDADFVFLLAQPQQARQIRPQLRFHHAADLAVYATSHVYAGHADAKRDADMNGIRFCDMPWIVAPEEQQAQLHASIADTWPKAMKRYPRLFALGIDAFQLLPHLGQLGPGGFGFINGLTGNLSVAADQHIYRELLWAEFNRGQPVLLEAALDINPAITDREEAPLYPFDPASPAFDKEFMDEHIDPRPAGGTESVPLPE